MEFFYLFLYRAISGAQNGLGYARSPRRAIATLAMMLFAIALGAYAIARPGAITFRIAAALCALLGLVSAIMVGQSFSSRGGGRIYDIHFWESITTGAITVGAVLAGGNLLLIAASVYPGLIMHKGFVNLGSGLAWWDRQTDDVTGKTFAIPLLGITIPRAATRVRVLLAIASIVLAALTFIMDWRFTVS